MTPFYGNKFKFCKWSGHLLFIYFVFIENDLEPSKPQRSVILFINEKKIKYPLTQNLQFTHHSNQYCNQNNTVSISLICGFELLKPKIKTNGGCVTNVLFIDPEICDKKVCIFV